MSALALPRSELGYADRMIHCGMVPNGDTYSIEVRLTSLHGIEVLTCSFDTDCNYGLFILTIICVIRKMESVMILRFVEILQFSKVLISLV